MPSLRLLGFAITAPVLAACAGPTDVDYRPVEGPTLAQSLPEPILLTAVRDAPASARPQAPADPAPVPVAVPTPPPVAGVSSPEGKAAAADFLRMEEALLAAPLSVQFEIQAEGVIAAQFRGTWQLMPGAKISLAAQGSFAGTPVDLNMHVDGTTVRLTVNGQERELPAPPALGEAVVLGWTRMGFLHNLAQLSDGFFIDHADGGVRDWAQAVDVVRGVAGAGSAGRPFVYGLTVSGTPAGDAVLYTDPASGRPLERRLVVHFPAGDMTVRETYSYE